MKYLVAVPLLLFASASHAVITLEDWAFNIDGDISEQVSGVELPVDGALVDGLGTLSLEISGEGTHSVLGFFDFEIAEDINTFFNEFGEVSGAPDVGQSWEIDEPGFVFGDIYDNVLAGSLDNTIGVTEGDEEDVAFAMGWDFSLLSGDIASIDFVFTDLRPTVDFFLTQTDPDLTESIYFYSLLSIATSGSAAGPNVPPVEEVPEPGTWSLYLVGLLGVVGLRKRVFTQSGGIAAGRT